MKYLTLILALVISATSYSQDETLYVNNTTSCTYQYTVSVYLEGTNCAVNQYQLKTPLTLTPSGAIFKGSPFMAWTIPSGMIIPQPLPAWY